MIHGEQPHKLFSVDAESWGVCGCVLSIECQVFCLRKPSWVRSSTPLDQTPHIAAAENYSDGESWVRAAKSQTMTASRRMLTIPSVCQRHRSRPHPSYRKHVPCSRRRVRCSRCAPEWDSHRTSNGYVLKTVTSGIGSIVDAINGLGMYCGPENPSHEIGVLAGNETW